MKFVCPRCRQHITSHDAAMTRCPACGLVLNVAMGDTREGQPALPIDRDLSGQTLGPYEIGECIGSGGMGIVYRATHSETGQTVALKVLAPYLSAQEDFVTRFQREAEALRNLRHPSIVSFFDEGAVESRHFIAMELVEGVPLEQQIRDRSLPVGETVEIGLGIGGALEAAHEAGITHRDLKPANVMLTSSGVKVLDFGIAQLAFPDVTLTQSEAILGTINYMAPEQRSRSQQIDHRADIFSLGVVLYRCLTGVLPFGSFEPPSRLKSEVPRKVDRILNRMLQRDPDRRHQSVTQVLADLQRLVAKPNVRRKSALVFAAAAFVLAVVGVGVSMIGGDPTAIEAGETAGVTGRNIAKSTTDTVPSPAIDGREGADAVATTGSDQPESAKKAEPATAKSENIGKTGIPQSRPEPLSAKKVAKKKAGKGVDDGIIYEKGRGFFRVVNVADNDVLNVRANPDPNATTIGQLPPHAACIQSAGQRKLVGKSWWRLVAIPGKQAALSPESMFRLAGQEKTVVAGWVNARFLKPQPASECGKNRSKGASL